MNGLAAPHCIKRCCCKCYGLDNICHTFFCNQGKKNDYQKPLKEALKTRKIETKEMQRIQNDGIDMSKNVEGIEWENTPDDIKSFVRGTLPTGVIESMKCLKEEEIKIR